MPNQMDWTEEGGESKPKRGRKKPEAPAQDESAGSGPAAYSTPSSQIAAAEGSEPGDFGDVAHLTKKGLRIVPVVTGAVVDQAGNFLFYVDGHEDARSGVQAQINHQLDSGPAREEYLGPARTRARELAKELSRPRSK